MRVALVIHIIFFLVAPLWARTIKVGKGQTAETVKKGVELAEEGDTLLIMPGTYNEGNIIIKKSITIVGQNYPSLTGDNKYEIFTIHANDLTVSGLKFIDTGHASMDDLAAIKVLDSKRVNIIDNIFVNTFFGIYFANSSHSIIKGNQLKAHGGKEHEIGNGIHLWKCTEVTIDSNTVVGHRDGIYFEFVTNSLIKNNHSEGNVRYGLHFMFSHDDEYRDNRFINNGAGVSVMYTKGVTMVGNLFDHNWGPASYGLLLKDIRDSHVRGNVFNANTMGIYMEGSSRIEFIENQFTRNGYAIRVQASCDDNVFTKNNFSGNTFDMATNGNMVLNEVKGNYWDKYAGYDLDKDNVGDVPYHPVSMYSMIVERVPPSVLLWRSFLVFLLDRAEKAIPAITPENLKDESPLMKPYDFNKKGK